MYSNGKISWHRSEIVSSTEIEDLTILFLEYFETIKGMVKYMDAESNKVSQSIDELNLLSKIYDDDDDDDDDNDGDGHDEHDQHISGTGSKFTKATITSKTTNTTNTTSSSTSTNKKTSNKSGCNTRRALSIIDESQLNILNNRNKSSLMKLLS